MSTTAWVLLCVNIFLMGTIVGIAIDAIYEYTTRDR